MLWNFVPLPKAQTCNVECNRFLLGQFKSLFYQNGESLIFLGLENSNWINCFCFVLFSHNGTLTSDLHNIFARNIKV